MLRFLKIRRLAVIESVEIQFDRGLNVLTGETGAGKSILVEAVGLLLGARAAGDLVRTGEETAIVEAVFESGGEDLLVRREITTQGRSRAFVNGDLMTIGALRERLSSLIELHGQHEHQTLLDSTTHLATLDAFGGFGPRLHAVDVGWTRWQDLRAELNRRRTVVEEGVARRDLLTFQVSELEQAGLTPGEDEDLSIVRRTLINAERIHRLCQESYEALYERDDAVLGVLGGVWRRIGELATFDARFQSAFAAREEIKSQLEDLAVMLRRYADSVDASPGKLQQVEDRLALLERLKKKHGPTLNAAIARRDELRAALDGLEGASSELIELEQAHESARAGYLRAANELSAARRRAAEELARGLEAGVAELAMAGARFDLRFLSASESEWSALGVDRAEFFVSPNPGEDLKPLARIASGGELSRIMLAMKTLLLAPRSPGRLDDPRRGEGSPGLIFDEVDAGIGGHVADVVGRRLRGLSSDAQVLCITHLPQIAAYADTHFRIEKAVVGGRTATTVTRLDEQGRVDELSRMFGGDSSSRSLRESAKAMLADRRQARAKGEHGSKGESESRPSKAGRSADKNARGPH